MTLDREIWEHDLRGPINRKIEQAKKAGRGVTVSPYWLTRILDRLDKHEPLKPCQHDLRLVKEKPCPLTAAEREKLVELWAKVPGCKDLPKIAAHSEATVIRRADVGSIPTPYASGNGWTLYHGDCLKVLPTLTGIDAVVTDPPYGMNYIGHSGGGRTIHNGKKFNRRTGHIKAKIAGDDVEFDPSPWTAYPCAMFGPQWYYHRLPAGGSLHSWDKRGDYKRCSFADADFVWLNKRVQSQTFRLVWRGICRHAENRDRIVHPTQKPVDVMEWVLGLLKLPKDSVVLDPFMGSATTGVACIKTGRKFIGIELDEEYCKIAVRRMQEAESHLFAEVKP